MFSPLVARCAPRLPASGFQYVLPAMTSHPGAYAPGYDMPSFQDFPALEHKNRHSARDCDMPPFQDFTANEGVADSVACSALRKCHHFPLFADTLSFYDPKNTASLTMKPYIVPKYAILVRSAQHFVNQYDNAFVVRKVVFGKVKGTEMVFHITCLRGAKGRFWESKRHPFTL